MPGWEPLTNLQANHPAFPGEAFLRVAADALDWCGASRADLMPLEGLRERFLRECAFRDRQNTKLQYSVLAAAAVHGGTELDPLGEVAWSQTDDSWQYALYAAVAQRHSDQFGTQRKRSPDGRASDHSGGSGANSCARRGQAGPTRAG